jgi:ethanolamine ammonia-lyase large subunit
MLGYQSTSFHDALVLRQLLGLRPAPEFEAWLERMSLSWRLPGPAAGAAHPLLAAPLAAAGEEEGSP